MTKSKRLNTDCMSLRINKMWECYPRTDLRYFFSVKVHKSSLKGAESYQMHQLTYYVSLYEVMVS